MNQDWNQENEEEKIVEIKNWFDLSDSMFFEYTQIPNSNLHKVRQNWGFSAYTVSQLKQSYRVINHWCEAGLIDWIRDGEKGWRKFNVYEVVWLRIIEELREFGFGLDKLKTAKRFILVEQDMERYMVAVLALQRDIEIVVYNDWRAFFATKSLKLKMDSAGKLERPHIAISFNAILKEIFGGKYRNPEREPVFVPVRKEDMNVFHEITSGNYDEIQLIFKNGKIARHETIKSHSKTENLLDSLLAIDFWKLEIMRQDAKTVQVKTTIQHKNT